MNIPISSCFSYLISKFSWFLNSFYELLFKYHLFCMPFHWWYTISLKMEQPSLQTFWGVLFHVSADDINWYLKIFHCFNHYLGSIFRLILKECRAFFPTFLLRRNPSVVTVPDRELRFKRPSKHMSLRDYCKSRFFLLDAHLTADLR